jgi:hypothetical protein
MEMASPALSEAPAEIGGELAQSLGAHARPLLGFLGQRNGAYVFESALHVFPTRDAGAEMGLVAWNSDSCWRNAYEGAADDCVFFAEDVFGVQFCVKRDVIHTFDPETGHLEEMARTLEEWAVAILADYPFLTGWPLAREWQSRHGPISAGKRLLPKIPFVLGGEYALSNLYLGNAVEGMRFRATIANAIKDVPDGGKVRLKVDE